MSKPLSRENRLAIMAVVGSFFPAEEAPDKADFWLMFDFLEKLVTSGAEGTRGEFGPRLNS